MTLETATEKNVARDVLEPSNQVDRSSPYRSDLTYPIGDGDADPFGHRDFADSIEAALDAVPTQFTLGLFGPWGSGKSTILDEVARRINQHGTKSLRERWASLRSGETTASEEFLELSSRHRRGAVLVIFDAWRYDGDSLRREFIRSVGSQLKEHGVLPRRFKVQKEVEAFEVDVTRPREARPRLTWAAAVSGLLSALIVAAVIGALYAVLAFVDPGDSTRIRAEIALLGPLLAFILVVAGRLVSPVQLQESRRRLEFPEQFMKAFQGLLDKARVDRVVIAIDNLDRCSPKRVAEMLTTIKTFLEPALQDRQNPGARSLSFIIAADDEALRRHLIAEEMSASTVADRPLGVQTGETGEALGEVESRRRSEAEGVAREAVDEYLRKFFNGSIRITDMLDDDKRDFTRTELADFIAWRDIDKDTERRLVELTAQGLKGNPRRIKQFVNNLELRLQLFQDRRTAGRIQIESDVMVLAKLAILEEDFPDAYRALREDPVLLDTWHEDAELQTPTLPPKLVGFLRFTNDIRTPYIAAYLTLKQTEDELTLPGYGEFIEMLDEANLSALTEGLQEMTPDVLARHVKATRTYFDRSVQRQSWSAAYGISRSVLELPSLQGANNEFAGHVLDRMLTHPELKARVLKLDPKMLLDVGFESLWSDRVADLVEALAAEATSSAERLDRLEEVSTALAAVGDRLDEAAKERLKVRLSNPLVRDRVASYVALAEALPEIVNSKAVAAVVQELIEAESVQGDDRRLRVAMAVLPVLKEGPELANQLLAALRSPIASLRGEDGAAYEQLAASMVRIAKVASDAGILTSIAQDLVETWGQIAATAHWPSLDLGLAVCAASTDADVGYGNALGRQVFSAQQEDEERARWASKNLPSMPQNFKAGFLEQLRHGVAGELGEQDEFLALADQVLGTDGCKALCAQAALEAIESHRYGAVERLFVALDETDASARANELADRAGSEPGAFLEEGPEGIGLLVEIQEVLAPEQVDSVAAVLVDSLVERRGLTPTIGPILGKLKIKDAGRRHTTVKRLVEFEKEVQNTERREGILRAAYLIAGKHKSNARDAIDERLEEVRDSGPQGAELVERVRGS